MLVIFILVLEYSIEDGDVCDCERSGYFFLFFLNLKVYVVEFDLHVCFSLFADVIPAH